MARNRANVRGLEISKRETKIHPPRSEKSKNMEGGKPGVAPSLAVPGVAQLDSIAVVDGLLARYCI